MRRPVVLWSLLVVAIVGAVPLLTPDFWVPAVVALAIIFMIVTPKPAYRFVAGNSFKRPGRRLAAARGDLDAMPGRNQPRFGKRPRFNS